MKTVALSIALLMSTGAFASESKAIQGQEALEIVDILTTSLGISGSPQGHSPETMCYNIIGYTLKGLYCERAQCTPEEGENKRVDTAACNLEAVSSKKELQQIKDILKAAGLNSTNSIFLK